MPILPGEYSKSKAIAILRGRGFTEHYDTGECGDGGYGSREYYCRPGAERNEFQQPYDNATISRLGGTWRISIFERAAVDG